MISIGMGEMVIGILGLVLCFVDFGTTDLRIERALEVTGHIAVGFLAIGFLTATVEVISHHFLHQQVAEGTRETRKQTLAALTDMHDATMAAIGDLKALTESNAAALQRRTLAHLDELQKTTAETLLRGMFGDDVFPAIREQLLQKPFVRTGYKTHLALERAIGGNAFIRRTTIRYTIKNVSSQRQIYELGVVEEWRSSEAPTRINRVCIWPVASGNPVELTSTAVQSPFCVRVDHSLDLGPGEKIRIEIQTEREGDIEGSNTTHFSHPTAVEEIEVSHPADLAVSLKLYHPNKSSLTVESDTSHTKKWSFAPVFLNYQGFEIEWGRKEPTKIEIGKIVGAPE